MGLVGVSLLNNKSFLMFELTFLLFEFDLATSDSNSEFSLFV